MHIIETTQLKKVYEGPVPVYAVNDVNLTFDAGEFTAIVGPSGSGKTTLLNLIGGLDRPTSGDITVAGTIMNELSENELIRFRLHNIGFVFQSYNLIPVLTARENAEFTMLLQKHPKKERLERVDQLLKEVGLADQAYKTPGALSGGQQQTVAVVRALAVRPAGRVRVPVRVGAGTRHQARVPGTEAADARVIQEASPPRLRP